MKLKNKIALTTITFFYILMSILMVWIIVFGIQKLADVQDTLSEAQRLEIQDKIKQELSYCNDPLSRDAQAFIELDNRYYNTLCIIGENQNPDININITNELNLIRSSSDNLLLIDNRSQVVNVIDSFKVDFNSKKDVCFSSKLNSNSLEIILKC